MSGLASQEIQVEDGANKRQAEFKLPWWRDNSIINLFKGDTLDKKTLEEAVGTLSIVCGLILTVPYSVMSNMSVCKCT